MIKTQMLGLTTETLQAKISQYTLKPYYYPTLFPLKQSFSLSWKTLEMQTGLKVAADLVARGARLDAKTREAINSISGQIPKIGTKRVMSEDDMYTYRLMLNMGKPDVTALMNAWANDTQFVWDAVASRKEWIMLRTISQGRVTITNDNNNSVISNLDITYPIPTSQKSGFFSGSANWATSASALPISKDMVGVQNAMVALGKRARYAFMNLNTFNLFAQTTEVIKMCQSYTATQIGVSYIPDVATVNAMMTRNPLLRGMQIIVIDTEVTIEKADGTRTTSNPFADNVVMYSDTDILGTTYWMEPVDMQSNATPAIKAMNNGIMIKRYGEEEPLSETTAGIANAFPVWDNFNNCYLQDVKNSTWSYGA